MGLTTFPFLRLAPDLDGSSRNCAEPARQFAPDAFHPPVEIGEQCLLARIGIRIQQPGIFLQRFAARGDRTPSQALPAHQLVEGRAVVPDDLQALAVDVGGIFVGGRVVDQRRCVILITVGQPPYAGIMPGRRALRFEQRDLPVERRVHPVPDQPHSRWREVACDLPLVRPLHDG